MKALRPLLPLLLLGIPSVASATVYYSTGFETLTNGQLAGQDSWFSDIGPAANVSVQSAVVKSGTKAISLDMVGAQPSTRAYRSFPAGANSVAWDFQLGAGQSLVDAGTHYRVVINDGSTALMSFVCYANGSVSLFNETAEVLTGVTLTPGVWYRIQLDFNFATSTATLSINSVRRSSQAFRNTVTSISQFQVALFPGNSATGLAYLDNISITDTPEPVATTISVVAATNNQSATVNTAFTTNLQALVLDQDGNPLPGVQVTFSGGAGAFASSAPVVTDSNGIATATTYTANTVAGASAPTATVTGSNPLLSATFALTNVAGNPANLTPLGAAQSAPVTATFGNLLEARVTDQYGNAVSGVTVTFSTGGAGTFSGSSVGTTNASGIAQSSTVVAGTTAGLYGPTASTSTFGPVNLPPLTVRPGPPSAISALGSPASAAVTQSLGTLRAQVTDAYGNGIPNVAVTFTAGGAGTFASSTTVTTSASGVATSPVVTASTVAGVYTPTASSSGLGSVNLPQLTVTAGPPATLTAQGAAQSAQVTGNFTNRLQAKVADQYGNPISGVTVTFSTGGAGTFSGGNVANTNSSGIAQSDPVVAGTVTGAYTPTASTSTLAAINLPQLNVLPGTPTDVNILSGSPQSRPVYTPFAPLVVVAVDQYGNPCPNTTIRFTSPLLTQASAAFSNSTNSIQLITGPNGQASTTPVANGIVGSYQVSAEFIIDRGAPAPRAPGAEPRLANPVNFALQNLPNPITVTVVTNITGPTVTANATTFTGTRVFTGVFNQGDPFTITTTTPQPFNGGQSQYVFLNGPNGSANTTQTLTLPFQSTVTYTMNFKAQHQVTFNTLPVAGGTINPAGTAFYDQGAVLSVLATPNANFVFAGFTGLLAGPTNPQTLTVTAPGVVTANFIPGDTYQLRYMSNLNLGDSVINLTNTGARGASLASGTTANITGAICANVYAFSPDEQMVSCCSCPVTPNGLVSLSARGDLISNTLTPAVPTSIVVKLLASIPDATAGCNNSASTVGVANLAPGLLAWGTTVKADPAGAQLVETRFVPATLSIGNGGANVGELGRLQQLCSFINANGSGFGVCRSCRLGGLGAGRQ